MELCLENICNHGAEFFSISYFADIFFSVALLPEETFLRCVVMA